MVILCCSKFGYLY